MEIMKRIYPGPDFLYLLKKNTCGEPLNIPTDLFWCAPKSLMLDYWYGNISDEDDKLLISRANHTKIGIKYVYGFSTSISRIWENIVIT